MNANSASAILVCAGESSRMKGARKIFLPLGGSTVLGLCLRALEACDAIGEIIVVAKPRDHIDVQEIAKKEGITKLSAIVPGGDTRQKSVLRGLNAVSKGAALIAIHDGARPLIQPEQIAQVVRDAGVFGAAALAVPVKDTIKVVQDHFVVDTPDRASLYSMQTPQVFKRVLYFEAAAFAQSHGLDYTDDCQMIEALGRKIYITDGDYRNLKITTPEDISAAEILLQNMPPVQAHPTQNSETLRIGHGYDVHRLVENRPLILGGVTIPFEKGLLGHSDADVLLHAIADAVLGALSLGDIGRHFPDTDPRYADADSTKLLRAVADMALAAGYKAGNVDATILCQKPKLAPYIPAMREHIAAALDISPGNVSVKATTEENLGFTGAGEGIAAHAVCLMISS